LCVTAANRFDGLAVVSRLFNFSDHPMTVTIKLTCPGVSFEHDQVTTTIAPGPYTVRFRPLNLTAVPRIEICTIDISTTAWIRRYLVGVGPLNDGRAGCIEFTSYPEYRYRARHQAVGELELNVIRFDRKHCDRPAEFQFRKIGTEGRYDQWEVEFDGRGRGRYEVLSKAGGEIKDARLEVIGQASAPR